MTDHDESFGIEVGDIVRLGTSPTLIQVTEFVHRGFGLVGNGHEVISKRPRIHMSPAHMFRVARGEI